MTPLDLAHDTAVTGMENRILLGFALQRSPAAWRSPAECMAIAGVSWARGENVIWKEAVDRLAGRGLLQISAWGDSGWRIPCLSPTPAARLPYERAAALRDKMSRARREARLVIPRYG